ncbi:ubiquitin carboxyl-terminal hydrolase [Sporobolomyces salmoneus]|uniref:ubiquitin carboxyl-terminal hydrolase n=1 Tax=Sporobolomyces salmoneus TaxID=183962 RepID=UPI00317C667E
MSSNYHYNSQYKYHTTHEPSYSPPTLSLVSSLIGYLLLFLVVYLLTFGNNSYKNLKELVQMSINSLLSGKAFGKNTSSLDWSSSGVNAKGKGVNGIRRRYVDTQEGREAWESGKLHFPGLLNAAGNLCFLNATLQSMASLPSLITYLDSLLTLSESFSSPFALPITSALYSTLTALNTPSTSSRPPPLRPLLLASALADSSESRRRLLGSSEQQDAHELWGMIRDAVEEESIKLSRFYQYEQHLKLGSGLNEVITLKKDGFELGIEGIQGGKGKKRREMTMTMKNDPWFWLRSQRIKCMNCGYVRDTRHEGEELLMLNVPPVSSCSIHDLLQEYTKPDLLSDYACRKCSMSATLEKYKSQRDRLAGLIPPPSSSTPPSANSFDLPAAKTTKEDTKMTTSRKDRKRKVGKLVDRIQETVDAGDYEKPLESESGGAIKMEKVGTAAGKSVNIARTPEILLIHLNRSTHYGYSGPIKNSCQVTFPEYLDLSPFCDHPTPLPTSSSASSTRDLYRLSSMVVHYGSHSFGHYVAFRRRPTPPPQLSNSTGTNGRLPEWYRISDETVDVSTIEEARRNNPFLLFYERVVDVPPLAGTREEAGEGAGLKEGMVRPRVIESWRVRSSANGVGGEKIDSESVEKE